MRANRDPFGHALGGGPFARTASGLWAPERPGRLWSASGGGGPYERSIGLGLAWARRGGGGGFNPLAYLGASVLLAWWDPSDATTLFQEPARSTPAAIGDGVGGQADKSGNSNHLQQASGAQRPPRAAGGVLTFNATHRLACADFVQPTQAQPVTVWLVGTNKTNLSTEYDIASPRFLMQRGASNTTLQIHAGASLAPTTAPDLAERRIKCGVYAGAGSKVLVNGVQIGTGSAGANGLIGMSVGGASTNFLVTGSGTTPLSKAEGLGEILVTVGDTSGDANLLAYLTNKWLA